MAITLTEQIFADGFNDVDSKYGPWASVEAFKTWMAEEQYSDLTLGITIGIKTNVVSETEYSVEEYWNPTDKDTFVKKGGSSIELDTTVPSSAEAASDAKAYSSKLSFTEIAKKQNALTQGYGIAIDASDKISVDSSKQVELVITTDDGTEETLKLFSFE